MIQAELSSPLPFTEEETRALKVFPRSPTSGGQNMNVTQFRVPCLHGAPEGAQKPLRPVSVLGEGHFSTYLGEQRGSIEE